MMRPSGSVAARTKAIAQSLPLIPARPPVLGMAVWLLSLGLLAGAIYVSSTIGVLILAGLIVILPLVWLVWKYPEFGLLAIVFLICGFISPDKIDMRLPIGGLDMRDMVLLGLLGILMLQGLLRGTLHLPWWPVSCPLLVFLGLAGMSMLYAKVYQGVEAHWSLNELRSLSYFMTFFITAWAITRPKQLVILLAGMFLLADCVAAVLIIPQFSSAGGRLLSSMLGNLWYVREVGNPENGGGVVRIVPPGHVLMFFMTIVSFCFLVFARQTPRMRAFFIFQFVYINFGLLLTFTRAQWIASTIAMTLVAIFLTPSDKIHLIRQLLIVVFVILVVFAVVGEAIEQQLNDIPFVGAMIARASTIFTPEETLESSSLQWRVFENDAVFHSLAEHPLLGVGLGNSYRDVTVLQGEARGWWGTLASGRYGGFTRYVHNSYLYIAVKMGLIGLLALVWFCLSSLVNCWRIQRRLTDQRYKLLVLAVLASFVGVLPWSITQTHLIQVESTAMIGIMIGMVANLRQIEALSAVSVPQVREGSRA